MSKGRSAAADNGPAGYEWEYARKKDDRTRWEKIKQGIWNSDSHEFLGRTAKSWGGILIFYVIFYGVLAVFFAICMKIWIGAIDERYPTWQLEESIIGTNPGMGFRPLPSSADEGSLIWYQAKNKTNIDSWVNNINKFLIKYNNSEKLPEHGHNQIICHYDRPPQPNKVCAVDINSKAWGPCVEKEKYGFTSSSPCIFLKLNRIYGWVPEYYNDTKNLPSEMPESLKNHIRSINDTKELNTIWVSCYGEAPADRENVGPIQYYPRQGFPGYYYPYKNVEGYLSPLVAIHLQRPALHSLINIECRAWAKNILYKRSLHNREGSVHFELMID